MKILLLFLIAPGVFLLADAESETHVNVDITLMCWDREIDVVYPGHDAEMPITVPKQVRSLRFNYEGPSQFLLSEVEEIIGNEEVELTKLASVEIPSGSKQSLVILLKNPATDSGGFPYRSVIVDDSFEIFPVQSIRFINFTKHELAGRLGVEDFRLPSEGESVIFATGSGPPKYLVPFRLARKVEGANKWRPVRSTIFSLPPRTRILVLLLENRLQPLELRFFQLYDYLGPAGQATTEASDN